MTRRISVLLTLTFLCSYFLDGQTIYYDYDNSGNLINRHIINLKKGIISNPDTLSTPDKKNLKEILEDQVGDLIIKIYPNPTQGKLFVDISGKIIDEKVDYQLYSQTGILLEFKKKIGCQFLIDFDRFPDGIYILRLLIDGKMSQWKILRE